MRSARVINFIFATRFFFSPDVYSSPLGVTSSNMNPNYFPSISGLIRLAELTPTKPTVHFQATNSFIALNFEFDIYRSSFPCTFLFFLPTHVATDVLQRFLTRHEQQYNIIFVEHCPNQPINLINTVNFGYFVSTIYLIYYTTAFKTYLGDELTPAAKICIKKQILNLKIVEVGYVICQGYCSTTKFEVDLNVLHKIKNPVDFHKQVFWTGHKKVVPAVGIGYWAYLNSVPGRHRHFCAKYVGTAISPWSTHWASLCEANLVAVVQLASTHNISFEILQSSGEEYNQFDDSPYSQFLGKFVQAAGEVILRYKVSGTFFADTAGYRLIYCKLKLVDAGYEVWVNALTLKIWIALVVTLGILKFYFWCKKSLSILEMVSVILGQGVSEDTMKVLNFVIFMYFIRNFFENALTSIVVAPSSPKLYTSLKEIILDNVTIVANPDYFSSRMLLVMFQSDFEHARIEHLFNRSFYMLPNHHRGVDKIAINYLKQQKGKKYAVLLSESQAMRETYLSTVYLLNHTKEDRMACHILKQILNPSFYFWQVYMISRHWLLISLRRMVQGGLLNQWDMWSSNLNLQRSKLMMGSKIEHKYKSRSFELVDLVHLNSIFVVCVALFYAALVSFLLEIFKKI